MIYTVTFNPAVDYIMNFQDINKGEINRSEKETLFWGGKGINVSLVLKELGVSSVAMGFVAGFTGEAIEKGVSDQGVKCDFVHLESGMSRINVKVKSDAETELNGQGPDISDKAISELFEKLSRLKSSDTLILAGSIPKKLPPDIYEKILERLSGRNIRFVVDATGDLLLNVLKYKPFLIKPNLLELEEIYNRKLSTQQEIISCGMDLQKKGAVNVLVSMASRGAILIDSKGDIHTMGVPFGKVINSVGAGDSMVAGFVAGCKYDSGFEDIDYNYALRLGTAAGAATAFSEGLAEKVQIDRLLEQI